MGITPPSACTRWLALPGSQPLQQHQGTLFMLWALPQDQAPCDVPYSGDYRNRTRLRSPAFPPGWQDVADPAGVQGTISDVILTAWISFSSLLHSFVPHIQIGSSLRQALRALSLRPALR